jgi:hypothetical protein
MSHHIKLTRALCQQILSAIRAGGYPYVAAEAFGVPKNVFDDWLDIGNSKPAPGVFRELAAGVRQAAAHARLTAEMKGHQSTPRVWLVNGPGRESDQRPGWSTSVKAAAAATPGALNVLEMPEVLLILEIVRETLQPHPEIQQKLEQRLENLREIGNGQTSMSNQA